MQKEKLTTKGIHRITLCKITDDKERELERMIEANAQKRSFLMEAKQATGAALHELWREYRFLIEQLHKLAIVREYVVENITTTVGRSVLAQRLGGDTTYTGTVNYCALGDDNTAPVVGDATLGNEVYRKALSSGTDLNNVAYLETFFTAAEDADTYEEYGFYIDGGAGADSGQLFNRFTQQIIKSNVETMNVQSIVTFADA